MICDWDDFEESNHRLDLLYKLKEANPLFKCTLFAVPGNSDVGFWNRVPKWCELAMHGWHHPHPREAEDWTYEEACAVLKATPSQFVRGWKSPGWQISEGTYRACVDHGFWVADQPYNDGRRPEGLLVHRLGDGHHLHGHIQDIGSNGLVESWDDTLRRVTEATSFELVSEVVEPWKRSLVTV